MKFCILFFGFLFISKTFSSEPDKIVADGKSEIPTSDVENTKEGEEELAEPLTLDEQYEEAVNSYTSGDYHKSIKQFKSIVVNNMMLQHSTVQCARKCRNSSIADQLNMDFKGFPFLETFGNKMVYGECFKTCMEGHPYRKVSSKPLPSMETLHLLEKRQPYNYLQFAYYKTNAYRKCCEAVTTYLQRNPNDESMLNNMKFYLTLPQVKEHYFRDLEAPKFHKIYRAGVEAYEEGKYKEAIVELEEALNGFYHEFDECVLNCGETPHEDIYFHRITKTAAVNEATKLKCTLQCEDMISPIIQDWKVENFTSRCYQFLQFAYFNLGETSQAVSCATSSFLLNPDAELSRQNVQYYQQYLKKKGFNDDEVTSLLQPRKDALKFYKMMKDNKEKLDLMTSSFSDVYGDESEVDDVTQDDEEPASEVMGKEDLVKMITASIENGLKINI